LGNNCLTIEFIAGNGSLNRSEEFLYTLLVPDRASTVFPCFDQPDMKAVFYLSLDIPAEWIAVSNGPKISSQPVSDKIKHVVFDSTKPISTYLFAFATGKFEEVIRSKNGRILTMYHRETDVAKLERNANIIFNSHIQALEWLEEYTQIPYPFGKLDFVLIPGFQYSGMEHPGAIFYRDSRLLLDESSSINEKLRQTNLIAHEVAHQWFGNLVTMQWFNDVWLKEVFASYMADLIVNPQYPEVNHELAFLLSHYPRSYSVDRTRGANPIVQPLENMLFAGTLYGDIIYHKSPIMMKQMVFQMGETAFRDGVREYLSSFYMDNATWNDLVTILNGYSEINLKHWANAWTLKTRRPVIKSFLRTNYNTESQYHELSLNANTAVPPMVTTASLIDDNTDLKIDIQIEKLPESVIIDGIKDISNGILLNSNGMGYGCFVPDSISLRWILKNSASIDNPLTRASLHVSLFEMFLENLLDRDIYFDFILQSINVESESQIRNYLIDNFLTVWWQFTDGNRREVLAHEVEEVFWGLLRSDLSIDQKNTVLSSLISIFISPESQSRLYTAWVNEEILGISLNESDRTKLAFELMIRKPELFEIIAHAEAQRIVNPERFNRFQYLLPAASNKPSERIAFAESLKIAANRKPEPWAAEGIRILHHPLRSDFSMQFIESMLDMLPDIQRTGDIFFPKSWLDAMLGGHYSPEVREIVDKWLAANPKLAPNLKAKVLQSVDMLYRIQ
jgi:aminopeptidase N